MTRKAKKNDEEIVMEIYRRLYKESEPSADIFELIAGGETVTPGWFNKYYLDRDRQVEIVEQALEEFKVSKHRKGAFRFNIFLGSAPSSVKPDE